MTPEERAAAEIAHELGFDVIEIEWEGLREYSMRYNYDGGTVESDASTFALWSLALRQRVKLNESK